MAAEGRRMQRIRTGEAGQNLIEFAVSALVLVLLLAGMVDFGGAFQNHIILTNASREGARQAARVPCSGSSRPAYRTAVINAVIAEAAFSNLTLRASDVAITPNPATSCPAAGAPVRVTVSHGYNTLFAGVVGAANITLSASTEMIFFDNG